MEKSKAYKELESILSYPLNLRNADAPGAFLNRIMQNSPQFAKEIKNLKSEDFQNLRPDALFISDSPIVAKRKEISKMLLDFDKKFF